MGKYDLNEQADADSQDVSKINAAGLINLRIQDAWNSCRLHYVRGDFNALRDELMGLWAEFFADAKPEQVKRIKDLDIEIAKAINGMSSRSKNKKSWLLNSGRYKRYIYRKWLFLKTLEKSQGVGKAYYDPGQDDWE